MILIWMFLKYFPIFMVQNPGKKWALQIEERGSHRLYSQMKTLAYKYQIYSKG